MSHGFKQHHDRTWELFPDEALKEKARGDDGLEDPTLSKHRGERHPGRPNPGP